MATLTNGEATVINRMNEASRRNTLGTRIQTLETDSATQAAGTSGILRKITQTVARAAFADGGAAIGTYTLTAGTIPVGATVLFSAVTAITGFIGDTSATIQIGDGTDVDRYSTGTPSVFTTAAGGIATGVPSGVQYHAAGKSVILTVTSAADFTNVSAGSVTVSMYYLA